MLSILFRPPWLAVHIVLQKLNIMKKYTYNKMLYIFIFIELSYDIELVQGKQSITIWIEQIR